MWSTKSDYFLLSILREIVWCLRLFSPISWLSPFFSLKHDGRRYSHPNTGEVYLLTASFASIVLLISAWLFDKVLIFSGAWAVLVVIENIQYQLQTIFIRPVFQTNYKPYSAERTLLIFIGQYIHTIIAFALIYLSWFKDSFVVNSQKIELTMPIAFEFSIVTITTLGFGSVYALPGTPAALVASSQAVLGVFLLGLIISVGVSRTSFRKSVIINSGDTIQKRCSSALKDWGYADDVQDLGRVFENRLWIVGGWVRNAALGYQYVGDIDCLVPLAPEEIAATLKCSGYNYQKNSLGAFRIRLPDGNHFDIMSTYHHCGNHDVLKALRSFNYSVNSAALNLLTNQLISTKEFELDISSNSVRFQNINAISNQTLDYSLMYDFEVLRSYYRLRPHNNLDWLERNVLGLEQAISEQNAEGLLRLASNEINVLIPVSFNGWIVRGFVRCAILGDLKYWDDIDVIVECEKSTLIDHLFSVGAIYSLNFYGNPKVTLNNGRKADIWPLPKTSNLDGHFTEYAHSADMLAWSVKEEMFVEGSLSSVSTVARRELSINPNFIRNAQPSDINYCIVKTLYLIIRHKFTINESTENLLKLEFSPDNLLMKNLFKLIKELHLCGIVNIENQLEYVSSYIGSNAAVIILYRKYWSPPQTDKDASSL
ncbi:ion channel [Nitrosomonas supralitoralis]|nr:ion channel [Nitrosomonas supralitoralis]